MTRPQRSLIGEQCDLICATFSLIAAQRTLTPSQLQVIDVQRQLIAVQRDLIRAIFALIATPWTVTPSQWQLIGPQ